MTINQEQISTVVKLIAENYQPEKIILFGSYAEDTQNENSDLDIAVIKETDVPMHHRSREIRKFLRGLKIPMDIIVFTKSEIEKWKTVQTAFITQILEKGKILYGEKRFD